MISEFWASNFDMLPMKLEGLGERLMNGSSNLKRECRTQSVKILKERYEF